MENHDIKKKQDFVGKLKTPDRQLFTLLSRDHDSSTIEKYLKVKETMLEKES